MSSVIVLVSDDGERINRHSLELLTLARRRGDPVAVYCGELDNLSVLAEYGATQTIRSHYSVRDGIVSADQYLVTPKVYALCTAQSLVGGLAILLPSTPEGKEIAG